MIERAANDVVRILVSEADTFRISIGASLEAQISKAVTQLAIIAVMISGALCILCASIFLLHKWLPWWQAFGILGLALLIVGTVSNAAKKTPRHV
ncbi:MAG TPA: hypothetical protein VMD75_09125 [Candidatus Binataceae bacterium]|nr:hypothetical protein [Candidatus Binataceae bacterium]